MARPSYNTSGSMAGLSPDEQFICEPLIPQAGTSDAASMARGEPGLPARFTWRGRSYDLVGVIDKWKSFGPCSHGSREVYLRRHWYRVQVSPHRILTVYCDRQAKDRSRPKLRWWVFSAEEAPDSPKRGDDAI